MKSMLFAAVLLVAGLSCVLGADVRTDPCCKLCELPKVKYFSIDTKFNNCGEACIDPREFGKYKPFEAGLTLANVTTNQCEQLGYSKYFETVTHGVPFLLTVDADLYGPTNGDNEYVTVHAILPGVCYEITVNKKGYEFILRVLPAAAFGSCSDSGYTVRDESRDKEIEVLLNGEYTFKAYTKPQ
eukprot:Colp12_sorted_trinity150504_noHs@20407